MQCPAYSVYGGQRTALITSVVHIPKSWHTYHPEALGTAEVLKPQRSPHTAPALVKTDTYWTQTRTDNDLDFVTVFSQRENKDPQWEPLA